MSKNFVSQLSPFMKLKMYDEKEKTVGLVKDKIQVVITLPNISDFSIELKNTIEYFSKSAECFVISSSKKNLLNKTIEKYELSKSIFSLDFNNFSKTFNLNNESNTFQKSLMIIDKNCKIAYKDILE